MRDLRITIAVMALSATPAAAAVPVTVQVIGADGQPLAGAVVTIRIPGTPPPAVRGPYSVAQRNIAFEPHILIVPVGATVTFPNFDKVRHHVYSFSAPKKFELKLFGREESRSVVFDKPGAIALGCNIHDRMNGVIYVTDSPYSAVTGPDGRAQFGVAKAGAGTVAVWHSSIRGKDNALSQPLAVPASGIATTLRLRR